MLSFTLEIDILGINPNVALPEPRTVSMPPELARALSEHPKERAVYDNLPSGRQKEILRYLGFLKNEESLMGNIERVLQHLSGEKSDALYAPMHRGSPLGERAV